MFHPGGPFIIQDDPVSSSLDGLDSSLVRFDVIAPTADPVTSVPSTLANFTPYDESLATVERSKFLSGLQSPGQPIRWLINGQQYMHHVNNDTVDAGAYEIWTVQNFSAALHPFHIHGGFFYILDRSGMPPEPLEAGKKDVVRLAGNESIRFIMRFPDYPDPEYSFMYHCHLLQHEDDGMMAQFIIVDSTFYNSVLEPDQVLSKLYPNPSVDLVTVEFLWMSRTLVVSNIQGQVAQRINLKKQKEFVQLEISNLPSGVYNVMVL